jgi:hypothetical protein
MDRLHGECARSNRTHLVDFEDSRECRFTPVLKRSQCLPTLLHAHGFSSYLDPDSVANFKRKNSCFSLTSKIFRFFSVYRFCVKCAFGFDLENAYLRAVLIAVQTEGTVK